MKKRILMSLLAMSSLIGCQSNKEASQEYLVREAAEKQDAILENNGVSGDMICIEKDMPELQSAHSTHQAIVTVCYNFRSKKRTITRNYREDTYYATFDFQETYFKDLDEDEIKERDSLKIIYLQSKADVIRLKDKENFHRDSLNKLKLQK